MSAFVFLVGAGPVGRAAALAPEDLTGYPPCQGARGMDRWRGADVECHLVRSAWEADPELAGSAGVVRAHGLVCVADASLYYRQDLSRGLRAQGIRPEGDTPSHFILAAYRAWGHDCLHHLDGDFAFAVWDPADRSLLAARDPSGIRALYSVAFPDGLALASAPPPLLRLMGGAARLSPEGLLRTLTFRDGDGRGTVWEGIHEVPAGHAVGYRLGSAAGVTRYGPLRRDPAVARLSEEDATQETRRLLIQACAERTPASGAAVAMSGGYDSTAIYAALQHEATTTAGFPRPGVVTAAFPVGDPGNEDEYVRAVLAFWQGSAAWVDVESVPVLDTGPEEAHPCPEPRQHHFQGMNRALARAARQSDVRVLLHGMLGDELFDLSPVYLADLLREGRWGELWREWRAFELEGARTFRRFCLRPLVPDWLMGLRRALRGNRLAPHPLGAPLPPWISTTALRESGILEKDAEFAARFHAAVREGSGRSAGDRERAANLLQPGLGRMAALIRGVNAGEGIELRGPFFDRHLMEFVRSRPRRDLVRSGETKILLRRAMEGLLPPHVLAPRPKITGSPEAYFLRGLRAAAPPLARQTAYGGVLGDLGLIDPDRFRTAVTGFLEGDSRFALSILHTLQTERWLRSQDAREGTRPGTIPKQPLPRSA